MKGNEGAVSVREIERGRERKREEEREEREEKAEN